MTQAGSEAVLDFETAFDRGDTTFTKAAAALEDLVARPPTGAYSFDLLDSGIRELKNMLLRALPLRSAREARAAQAISLAGLVEEGASLRLGQAVDDFLGTLQIAADRQVEERAASRARCAAMTVPPVETLTGVVARLRAFQEAVAVDETAADASLAQLVLSALPHLERLAEAEAAQAFDATAAIFEAEARTADLPISPTETMVAAGAKAGKMAVEAVRRMYQAMVAEHLVDGGGARK